MYDYLFSICSILKDAGVTLMIIATCIKAKQDIKYLYAYAFFILILLIT